MEIVIGIVTTHFESEGKSIVTKIDIDNSTDAKDFLISATVGEEKSEALIILSDERKTVSLCGVTLRGREVDLLREFLNQ